MVPFSRAELQGVQNAAARLITGTRKFDHVTPILRELHWLPVAQQIQYKIAMLVNKMSAGLAPPYLAELCRPVVHLTGRRHLRSAASRKLDVQRTATAIGRRNFAVSGPETWNSFTGRHCSRPPLHPPLHDAWKRIYSSALNDMCLQLVWFHLRLPCL